LFVIIITSTCIVKSTNIWFYRIMIDLHKAVIHTTCICFIKIISKREIGGGGRTRPKMNNVSTTQCTCICFIKIISRAIHCMYLNKTFSFIYRTKFLYSSKTISHLYKVELFIMDQYFFHCKSGAIFYSRFFYTGH
jgi:hypothetical protein